MYHIRQHISISIFIYTYICREKRTDWEGIHEDVVISDYLQVVESQVIYSFIRMFSKSFLVSMNYLQKRKKMLKIKNRKSPLGRINRNKSDCADNSSPVSISHSLKWNSWIFFEL